MSTLRPEIGKAAPGTFSPTNGTAYLMILNAVGTKRGLITGQLHRNGESCAIGSYFDINPRCALPYLIIDEVAAVNDSMKGVTPRQRKLRMMRWLRWRLKQCGMPEVPHD